MSSFERTTLESYEFNLVNNIPLMIDSNTLAFHLKIRNKTFWYLQKNKDTFYRKFAIPKKDKYGNILKLRNIQAPIDKLKNVHSVINSIFSQIPLPDNVGSYVPGKSCADTAQKHIGKSVMIGMDITNFFNSTKRSYIREYLHNGLGYSHHVSSLLSDLCTCSIEIKDAKSADGSRIIHFLPQGSPLSGAMANLVAWHRFGNKIQETLKKLDPRWEFTIYSDDIILSHPDPLPNEAVDAVRDTVINIVTNAGYKINKKKTRILRKGTQHKVLGCVVNEKLNIPRMKYNKIKCLIHNCKVHGFESQAKRCGKTNGKAVVAYIKGMLQYFKQIREDRFERLSIDLEEALALQEVK